MASEQLNPRVDLAFKKIFGSEENKDLLMSFINSIVSKEDQIVSVELLNPYNLQQFLKDKGSIVDIKAKDAEGNYYHIEVQISDEADYDKRALFYWARLYSEQIQKSGSYGDLRKAIGIHVLNFTSIPDTPDYANKFTITNDKTKKRYFENFELYTIELNKFSEGPSEDFNLLLKKIKTGLDRWVTFLTKAYCLDTANLPKELDDPCIKKAMDVLKVIHLSQEERELYNAHLDWLRMEESILSKAESKGIEKGREEGKAEERAKAELEKMELQAKSEREKMELLAKVEQEKIEMAKKRLKRNHPIAEIAEDTGLSVEKVKAIQASIT